MRRLICACVVRKPQKTAFLASRPILFNPVHEFIVFIALTSSVGLTYYILRLANFHWLHDPRVSTIITKWVCLLAVSEMFITLEPHSIFWSHFVYICMSTFLNYWHAVICLFVWFDSLRPIKNASVITGRVFLGWTSTKLGLMLLLKDITQWSRWGSNPRPFSLESSTLPLSHCAPWLTCNSNKLLEIHSKLLNIIDLWVLRAQVSMYS